MPARGTRTPRLRASCRGSRPERQNRSRRRSQPWPACSSRDAGARGPTPWARSQSRPRCPARGSSARPSRARSPCAPPRPCRPARAPRTDTTPRPRARTHGPYATHPPRSQRRACYPVPSPPESDTRAAPRTQSACCRQSARTWPLTAQRDAPAPGPQAGTTRTARMARLSHSFLRMWSKTYVCRTVSSCGEHRTGPKRPERGWRMAFFAPQGVVIASRASRKALRMPQAAARRPTNVPN